MKTPDELPMIEGASCEWPRSQQPRIGRRSGVAWYLLQVKNGGELKVAEFLHEFGYEVYYPKTTVLRKVPKRQLTPSQRRDGSVVRRPQLVPIFPGYPYIRFDIEDGRLYELFDYAGVHGIHCAGEHPVVVDDTYIAHLKGLEDEKQQIPAFITLKDLFGVGDSVLVQGGPFRGFTGIVEELPAKLQHQINENKLSELDESMCATIAIQIFGRATSTRMPIGDLEKLG